ncbi:MAG: hypothetical protein M1824_000161 [Vezdaea acicularis]|nr:MAG: hypothetical protein M1824_000161 [Vezdaea acicularis]
MSDRLLHPPPYLAEAEPLLSEEDLSEEEGFNISPSSRSSNSLSRSPSPPHSHDVNRPSRGSISIEMNAADPSIPLNEMTRSEKMAKRRYDNRNKIRKNGRFITAVGSSRSRTFLSIITIAYLVLVPTVIHFASPSYNHFDFWCAETTWPLHSILFADTIQEYFNRKTGVRLGLRHRKIRTVPPKLWKNEMNIGNIGTSGVKRRSFIWGWLDHCFCCISPCWIGISANIIVILECVSSEDKSGNVVEE